MTDERWLAVPGYEDRYEISDRGRLRSLRLGRIMAAHPSTQGYLQVHLYRPKPLRPKTFKIHRLVAMAFIPNPDAKAEVNHIDLNILNNCVSNLEWATKRENVDHAYANGYYDPTKHPKRLKKLSLDDVAAIRAARPTTTIAELSKQFGVGPSHISKICNGYSFRSNSPVKWKPSRLSADANSALCAMRDAGTPAKECAKAFGISQSRAHKIIRNQREVLKAEGSRDE